MGEGGNGGAGVAQALKLALVSDAAETAVGGARAAALLARREGGDHAHMRVCF
jgi:hypothetical protein